MARITAARIRAQLINAENFGYVWDCSVNGFAVAAATPEPPAPPVAEPTPTQAPTPAPAPTPTTAAGSAPTGALQPRVTLPTTSPLGEIPEAAPSGAASSGATAAASAAVTNTPTTNYTLRFTIWLIAALGYYVFTLFAMWRF